MYHAKAGSSGFSPGVSRPIIDNLGEHTTATPRAPVSLIDGTIAGLTHQPRREPLRGSSLGLVAREKRGKHVNDN